MRKNNKKILLLSTVFLLGLGLFTQTNVFAETEQEDETEEVFSGTSISLMPVSKILQINSSSVYEDVMKIKNDGGSEIKVEVYATPYSYIYSEEDDSYKLGFNNENKFTQMSRWISIKDVSGKYVEKAYFTIPKNDSLEITYRISTPDSIPGGGQYAVIFAHTLSSNTSADGIRTEASPGMVIYGRSSEGETIVSPEISNLTINQSITENGESKSLINASAKVKNNGNVDFTAVGVLKVEGIFGGVSYETPNNRGRVSLIPESALEVYDAWEDTPAFGLFKATWTVTAGEEVQTTEKLIFINPVLFILIIIMVLTIIIICVTIFVRKRKDRRARLSA